jgi:2-polyprenyl-3-methyl-5-hydroxy-6-metoxy-1,4-benzoquinol methylase
MDEIIKYIKCPGCGNNNIVKALRAKDFTVSGELFEIWHCNDCSLRFTQNIPSQNAIGKYYQSQDYVSHSDTKKGFINRLYHLVRNHTLQSKKKLIVKYSENKNGNLLDVGAGTGAFTNTMQLAGWNVTGLEPDETARENAFQNHNLQLQTLDALFQQKKNSFDVITMWHVLEHVHELHNYLDTFQKILKPNGALIIAVPNYTSEDAKHYGEFWAAYDVPRHLYHFSPASMEKIMEQHRFKIADFKPMRFDSFYVSMLSEKYKNGKNNFVKALIEGIRSNATATKDVKRCSSVIYVVKREP